MQRINELIQWLDTHSGLAQWSTGVIGIIAIYFAWQVGKKQNEINNSLKLIEDSVEVYGYCRLGSDGKSWFFLLTNVGKLQLYLLKYRFGLESFDVDRALIPANQQQNAWYSIKIPKTDIGSERILCCHFEDHLGRAWDSIIKMKFVGDVGWDVFVQKIKRA